MTSWRSYASWVMSQYMNYNSIDFIICVCYRIWWNENSSIYIWMCVVSDIYMVFPKILNKHLKLSKLQFKCYKIQLNYSNFSNASYRYLVLNSNKFIVFKNLKYVQASQKPIELIFEAKWNILFVTLLLLHYTGKAKLFQINA